VLEVADGEAALRVARDGRPDVVLLDITMPRLDGLEVTRRLRAEAATRGIGVVLLTARVEDRDVARGLEAGADEYLRKPFSARQLRARVEAALAAR
jgi:DNA-binding response OmpR family regulator